MATAKLPKSRTIFKEAFNATKKNMKALAALTAPFAILVAITVALFAIAGGAETAAFALIGFLLYIALIVYGIWLSIVMMRVMFQAIHESSLKLETAKKDIWKLVLPLIGLSFVTGIVTLAGFYLLIIPGIIISMMYFAAKGALIIRGKGVHESIYFSTELTRGRKWNLFWTSLWAYVLGLLTVYIPGAIIIGILLAIGSAIGNEVGAGILGAIGYIFIILFAFPFMTGLYASLYGHLEKKPST